MGALTWLSAKWLRIHAVVERAEEMVGFFHGDLCRPRPPVVGGLLPAGFPPFSFVGAVSN